MGGIGGVMDCWCICWGTAGCGAGKPPYRRFPCSTTCCSPTNTPTIHDTSYASHSTTIPPTYDVRELDTTISPVPNTAEQLQSVYAAEPTYPSPYSQYELCE